MGQTYLRKRSGSCQNDLQNAFVLVENLRKLHVSTGIGWMVNRGVHYGPNVDGYEYSKWGTYHYADHEGMGVYRTAGTGTGFVNQYRPEVAEIYESLEKCPDELLLFFHHVPYTYRLKSGKTVIQHIYDSHFDGVERVIEMKEKWIGLKNHVDKIIFDEVLERLELQLKDAIEWRDEINTYFFRKSGIKDELGKKSIKILLFSLYLI